MQPDEAQGRRCRSSGAAPRAEAWAEGPGHPPHTRVAQGITPSFIYYFLQLLHRSVYTSGSFRLTFAQLAGTLALAPSRHRGRGWLGSAPLASAEGRLIDDDTKHAIAIRRAHRHTIGEIADEFNLAYGSVYALMRDDGEIALTMARERERMAVIKIRELELMSLDTGTYRKNMHAMAVNVEHPKHFDANKLMLEYTVGAPAQRHEHVGEHTHRIDPEQLLDLRKTIADATAKMLPATAGSLDAVLLTGAAALPSPEEIAEQSVEGQLAKKTNGGS